MRRTLLAFIAVLVAPAPIWAHHGSTGFDQMKPVHLVGRVSLLEWNNPHVVVHLDVSGADGQVTTWLVNTFPPNAATRRGFSKSSFEPGTELTVDGYQATDGSNHVNGTSIVFKDGKKIVSPDCFATELQCFTPSDARGTRIR